jgi:hypothetical protein
MLSKWHNIGNRKLFLFGRNYVYNSFNIGFYSVASSLETPKEPNTDDINDESPEDLPPNNNSNDSFKIILNIFL